MCTKVKTRNIYITIHEYIAWFAILQKLVIMKQ